MISLDNQNHNKTVLARWLWNKLSWEVRCSNCKATVGVCFTDTALAELKRVECYCYNCGATMFDTDV